MVLHCSGTGSTLSILSARRIVGFFSLGEVISMGLIFNLSGVVGVLLAGDLRPSN